MHYYKQLYNLCSLGNEISGLVSLLQGLKGTSGRHGSDFNKGVSLFHG